MDFEKLKAFRQNCSRFTERMGITVEEIRPGYSRVSKSIGEDDLNPIGRAHGGVYFTLADHAAGTAMATCGYLAVTVNATYNYFRSANPGDQLTAEAQEVKAGKTLCVFDVRVTDQNGALLGSGTFTFYRLEEKLDL
ncbi:MAG: PaaI family thioesterase [Ruminococcaceae bacterium]|nr:PaaI family thioesterase [Oscillospiraceae bacterium]